MVCILFSGGLDSMVLAEMAFQNGTLGALLHVSYGQRASAQEYRAARKWAKNKGVSLERLIVSVRGLDEMNQDPGIVGARVVPGRNLILISHAVNHSMAAGLKEVWFGACADDFEDYADCRPDFVDALNALTFESTGVQIKAPLIDKTKAEIVNLAASYKIEKGTAWSCYAPKNDSPCGRCNSCIP